MLHRVIRALLIALLALTAIGALVRLLEGDFGTIYANMIALLVLFPLLLWHDRYRQRKMAEKTESAKEE